MNFNLFENNIGTSIKSILVILLSVCFTACSEQVQWVADAEENFIPYKPLVSFNIARNKADSIVKLMSLQEKIEMIGGRDIFFTKGFEKYRIPPIRFSDAGAKPRS